METQDFYCDFILNDKISFKKIKETDNVLAFYHTKPSYKTHIVVIPKKHIASFSELDNFEIVREIFEVISLVVKELKLSDFRIINNNGKYQDSKHLHFHLISES
jgi:histidine triad (HIT) family protein